MPDRIAELREHPRIARVLADIPEAQRELILRCIVSKKKAFPLSAEQEDEAFVLFVNATMEYVDAIIQQVLAALD